MGYFDAFAAADYRSYGLTKMKRSRLAKCLSRRPRLGYEQLEVRRVLDASAESVGDQTPEVAGRALTLDEEVTALASAQIMDFTCTTTNGEVTITGYTGAGGAVEIPSRIDGLPVTAIGGGAFAGQTSLTSVTIPFGVKSIGDGAFTNCTSLTDISLPSGIARINSWTFGYCSQLAHCTIPASVTSIGDCAFQRCESLTELMLPLGLTVIGKSAFSECVKITHFSIPPGVTSVPPSAFSYCYELETCDIPEGVTSIGEAAFLCTSITSVSLPNTITSIGSSAFSSCAGLSSLTIPGNVTSIGGSAFSGLTSLSEVLIPASVTSIGDGAFVGCSSLLEIAVDPANPAYESTDGVLYDRASFTLMQCPPGKVGNVAVQAGTQNIGLMAFLSCSGLENVVLPNSLQKIGNRAFEQCYNLRSLSIPGSVRRVGNEAFWGSGVASLYMLGDAPQAGAGVFARRDAATAHYLPGTTGWSSIWAGIPAVLATTPSVPLSLAGVPGNVQVSLTWTAPSGNGGSAITDYTIQYSSNGGSSWTLFPDGISIATAATVTGLTNGISYVFRVGAVNGVGTSVESSPVTAIPCTVPTAPINLTGVPGNAQVSLSWTAPSGNGGSAVTDYTIQYSSNGGSSWTLFTDGISIATAATVTGLTNGTPYVFRVAAVNIAGRGARSGTLPAIPCTVATAPTNVIGAGGDSQVALNWTAPNAKGCMPITEYRIRASSDGGKTWPVHVAAGAATSAIVPGLQNGVPYLFKVRAVSAAGLQGWSVPSALITPRTVPGVARVISGTSMNGQVNLTWIPPVNNGGSPITGYRVRASGDGGRTWTLAAATGSAASDLVFPGLRNGTAYLFRVRALNAAGLGDWSVSSAPVTPWTVPGSPSNVRAVSGPGGAGLSWSTPTTDGGSPILKYRIEYSVEGGNTLAVYSDLASTLNSETVFGLTAAKSYVFRVSAINAAGAGVPSPWSNAVVIP